MVVMPESWKSDDTSVSAIAETIVVRHNTQVQKKVRQFLSDLQVLPD